MLSRFFHRYETLHRKGPLSADHPLVKDFPLVSSKDHLCPACGERFEEGDYVTLIRLGPGTDSEERRKCATGNAYNAVSAPVHWACATGEEE